MARGTGVRLAFIAALHLLSARQRAMLTLRDVPAFRTAEVAAMLDTTTAAVDSTLRPVPTASPPWSPTGTRVGAATRPTASTY